MAIFYNIQPMTSKICKDYNNIVTILLWGSPQFFTSTISNFFRKDFYFQIPSPEVSCFCTHIYSLFRKLIERNTVKKIVITLSLQPQSLCLRIS